MHFPPPRSKAERGRCRAAAEGAIGVGTKRPFRCFAPPPPRSRCSRGGGNVEGAIRIHTVPFLFLTGTESERRRNVRFQAGGKYVRLADRCGGGIGASCFHRKRVSAAWRRAGADRRVLSQGFLWMV